MNESYAVHESSSATSYLSIHLFTPRLRFISYCYLFISCISTLGVEVSALTLMEHTVSHSLKNELYGTL